MFSLPKRLKLARLSIADQADYLQQLIDQFDMPYDVCCSMQVIIDDLKVATDRLRSITTHMPKKRPRRSPPNNPTSGKS